MIGSSIWQATGQALQSSRKFSNGADGERVDIDAIEFVRILSGRLPGAGILSHPLPL